MFVNTCNVQVIHARTCIYIHVYIHTHTCTCLPVNVLLQVFQNVITLILCIQPHEYTLYTYIHL